MPTFNWYLPSPTISGGRSSARVSVLEQLGLGTDVECLRYVGKKFVLVSGSRNVALAICRRLLTPRGRLFYDPNYGFDLAQYCNAEVSTNTMDEIRSGVEAEALKDPRVKDARCVVSWEPSATRFVVSLRGVTSAGPFRLVMGIASATVETLKVES